MTATVLDDRRRLVMPRELKPRDPVTVQQIDADTWVVKRQREQHDMVLIAVPIIKRLTTDAEWEKKESEMARHTFNQIPPFEE